MRSPTPGNFCCLLLLWAGLACLTSAQEKKPKTHVFLFDESGSMEHDHRYDHIKEWLVGPLLKSGAFEPGDRVVVRWFSQVTPQTPEGTKHGLKVENKEYSEQTVLANVPGPHDARGGNTDIPQALDLVLEDINDRYKIQGDVLIWIVTDNNQDKHPTSGDASAQASDITPFYQKINERKGKLFRAAYLFPLVKEGNTPILRDENAMIMYLLHYSAAQQPDIRPEETDRLARAVAKNIDNPVIAWFISESSFVPSFEGVSDDDVEFDQGSGVIQIKQPLPEGQESTRDFKFKLKSLARQRNVSGQIAKERFVVSLPDGIEAPGSTPDDATTTPQDEPLAEGAQPVAAQPAAGNGVSAGDGASSSWSASIRPQNLSLKPDETSPPFTATLTAPALRPTGFGGFWAAVFNSTSDPFTGQLQFELNNLQAELQQDDSPLFHVNNTKYIKDIVQKSVEKPRPFSYDVQFVVGYNSGWRRALAGGLAALLIVFAVGLVVGLRSRTRYELTTPTGEERALALPLVGKEYVTLDGERAAVISKRFGRLSVAPVGNYRVDGATAARTFPDGGGDFALERQDEGRKYNYSLRRVGRPASVEVKRDDFLD